VKYPLRFVGAILLGLPGLGWGYAYTTVIADGSFKQNQTTGDPVVWSNPLQGITFNFGGSLNAAASAALDEWNGVNTPLQYHANPGVAQTCADDSFNSAGFGALTCDNTPFGDALAITKRSYTQFGGTWYLREADIVLDKTRRWQVYSGPLRAGVEDFHRVILHELGHALGLDHPDQAGQIVVAIMNSRTGNIDTLQDDDRQGVIRLYGSGTGGSTSTGQAAGAPSGGGGGAAALLAGLAGLGRRLTRGRRVASTKG
jgi:hypothetical protein